MARFSDSATLLLLTVLSTYLLSVSGTFLVTVDTTAFVTRLPEGFLSVTIDAGAIIHNFKGLNFSLPRVVNMAKGLSPAVLRVGGSSEDRITYAPDSPHVRHAHHHHDELLLHVLDRLGATAEEYTMNFSQWDTLNHFAEQVGWNLTFGLNSLKRQSSGAWNSTNARLLIEHTVKSGYHVNWELGNEPDLYYKQNISVRPEDLARDFASLKALLKEISPNSFLAGPDVATLKRDEYFERFLRAASAEGNVPDVITWHQYYEDGRTAKLSDFYDYQVLDKLMDEMEEVAQFVGDVHRSHTPLWLGETSSCYGGGAPGISNTFVAGFLWLDKLGLAALNNYSHICRQTFWGGWYSLINSTTLEPLPDYWASLAYKRLVGREVLSVKGQTAKGRTVRVYAHCTRQSSSYPPGSVTVFAMNIEPGAEGVTLEFSGELRDEDVDQYLMQSGESSPTSRTVTLNGNVLTLVENESLPLLPPKKVPAGEPLRLPALSYAFYVVPDANAPACKT